MSFLLKVKFVPATNFRGSRVSAKSADEKLGTTISWDDEKNAQENYDAVVEEWIKRADIPNSTIEYIGEWKDSRFYRIWNK